LGRAAKSARAGAPLQGRPGDNAPNARVNGRLFGHPVHFLAEEREIGLALHKDHLLDVDPDRGGAMVRRQMRPIERRHALQPGIAQSPGVPDVQVRIDDRDTRHVRLRHVFSV
jgi:hypothetical protein